jgi:nitroimidazol reductase NimA-like FMN-containing flavoprotein (pyridoxamine 5'-phosphate oxidase superfamily)
MPYDPIDAPVPENLDLAIRRLPERAAYDRASIDAIIDAALVAHVGTVRDGRPLVIPVLAARDGDWLLIHGAPAAGTMRRGRGEQVCVTMTVLDGLVLARSAFHHSLNYRSVVVIGEAEVIADLDERGRALDIITERVAPGRGAHLRPTTTVELKQTAVLRVSLEQASAKIRTGPPKDDEEDYALPIWAGVLPIRSMYGEPVADPRLPADVPVPGHVVDLSRTEP